MILSSQVYHYILKVDLKQNQITIQIHQCGEHTNIAHETSKSIWFFMFYLVSLPNLQISQTSMRPRNNPGTTGFSPPLNSSATFTASPGLEKVATL